MLQNNTGMYSKTKQQQWMGNKKYQEYVDSFQAIYVRPSVNVSLQAGHVIIWIKQKTQAYCTLRSV